MAVSPGKKLCHCCSERSSWNNWIKDEFVSELAEHGHDVEQDEDSVLWSMFFIGCDYACEYIDGHGDDCSCNVEAIAEAVHKSYKSIREEVVLKDKQLSLIKG